MRVRLAGVGDGGGCSAIYRTYVEQTVISFETVAPGREAMEARIAATLPAHPWLVADDGDRLVGYAYAHPFGDRDGYRWSVETSVYVRHDTRGRGIGRTLYSALLDVVAAQGHREAFGGITLPNPASVALHERLGFRPAATFERAGWKHGAWHDVGWWQRHLVVGRDGVPVEPRSVTEMDPDLVGRLLAPPP